MSSFLLLICLITSTQVVATEDNNRIELLEHYYNNHVKTAQADDALALAQQIVRDVRQYDDNTIAKAYVLLSSVALLRKEFDTAEQFTKDGLQRANVQLEVKIKLLFNQCQANLALKNTKQLLQCAKTLIREEQKSTSRENLRLALSYSALGHALNQEFKAAISDIQRVTTLMKADADSVKNPQLLSNLAQANHQLGSYQAALNYYMQLLSLKFELDDTDDIAQTYYQLAQEYRQLGKYDDAFNAYWEGRRVARQKGRETEAALAELGLAQLQLAQQDYHQAYNRLIQVEKILHHQQQSKAYLSVLIGIAESALAINKSLVAYQVLAQAEGLIKQQVDREQIKLYQLLAEKYQVLGDYQTALTWLNRYITQLNLQNKATALVHQAALDAKVVTEENKQVTLNLTMQNQLRKQLEQAKQQKNHWILLFVVTALILLLMLFILWMRLREARLKLDMIDTDRPDFILPNPRQTQKRFQLAYIMARKYEYPITIVYLQVVNWQDLAQTFRAKVMQEVNKTLASLINEHISEFDFAGLLADGEYIIAFPHQTLEQVNATLTKLNEKLKAQLFANLGAFSVMIDHKAAMPEVQDIDPFVFLNKLKSAKFHKV